MTPDDELLATDLAVIVTGYTGQGSHAAMCSNIITRIKDAGYTKDDEVAHLRRWKSEASEVIIGLQDLGRALGIPPGQRITGPLALEYVARLKENQR